MELASPVSHIALLLLSRCPAGVISLINVVPLLLGSLILAAVVVWAYPGGPAWGSWSLRGAARDSNRRTMIPGPRGLPIVGSLLEMGQAAHLRLAKLATLHHAKRLMAFSLGDTRVVLTCVPSVAKELLSSSAFADRPIKQSAKLLLFERAIGFAPYGDYWRKLRRIAATHLFAPTRLAALEASRQLETAHLLQSIHESMEERGVVQVRGLLQKASVNNIMKCVFGRRYDFEDGTNEEAAELQRMMREGFELLGACNWNDHLSFLCKWFDFQGLEARCKKLAAQVQVFVEGIVDEHKKAASHGFKRVGPQQQQHADSDFVDVMLSLQTDENLSDSDLVAILWEMIFRGTDTTAILMEWILAEMVLNPDVQARAHAELDRIVGHFRRVEHSDVARLPYLQAIVKEALRVHPPGPLLSWARLATQDADLAGFHVPAGTTAMVNMWAITHDAEIWEEPGRFKPERFLAEEVDVRGSDLRLAPFGAGRRVCPGRALGLATVQLWAARLLQHFEWTRAAGCETVDMSEVLKLSCEMRTPLMASATPRSGLSSLPNF